MGTYFNINLFNVEQNNYTTSVLNAYIVYNLVNWSKVPLFSFTLNNFLLGETSIARNSDENK